MVWWLVGPRDNFTFTFTYILSTEVKTYRIPVAFVPLYFCWAINYLTSYREIPVFNLGRKCVLRYYSRLSSLSAGEWQSSSLRKALIVSSSDAFNSVTTASITTVTNITPTVQQHHHHYRYHQYIQHPHTSRPSTQTDQSHDNCYHQHNYHPHTSPAPPLTPTRLALPLLPSAHH